MQMITMAIVAMGVSFSMEPGNVLAWLGNIIHKLPEWIHKPLGLCSRCAVSVWGTTALVVLGMFPERWWTLPFLWLGAAGLQEILGQ